MKTQRELQEILHRLDSVGKIYNPFKKRSLHARLYVPPKPSTEELDIITDDFLAISESNDYKVVDENQNHLEEFVEICLRISELYYQAENYVFCLLYAEFMMVGIKDMESKIETWIDAAENLDLPSLQKLHLFDCWIDSYNKCDEDFHPEPYQIMELMELLGALKGQSSQIWRLEVDNLRRQLDLCRAILKYSKVIEVKPHPDKEIKKCYVNLCQDLLLYSLPDEEAEQRETEEEANKFFFIKDITKDKEAVCDYLQYATTLTDVIDKKDLDDFEKCLNYLKYNIL